MKLEKFKEKNNNKTLKISLVALGVMIGFGGGYILNKSLASYQETKKFNVIEGTVKYEGSGDLMMAFYQDDNAVNLIPNKDKNYLEKAECNNGATIEWDENLWTPKVLNLTQSKTKCNFYFKRISLSAKKCIDAGKPKATDCITLLSNDNPNDFAKDGTAQNNLRYIGPNPDNYISFNNELWRIIGVMNNVDNGSGVRESRLKIIRNESLERYAWDSSPTNINHGLGINEWSQADLMKLMNPGYESQWYGGSLYWNRTSGSCYKDDGEVTIPCDFTTTGLTTEAKQYFDTAVWHTGTTGMTDSWYVIPSDFYNYERSNNTGKKCTNVDNGYGLYLCNDTVSRTTTWKGKVGLIYPSDYGYAVGGNDRTTCLGKGLGTWRYEEICYANDWLFDNGISYWTITPNVGYIENGVTKEADEVLQIGGFKPGGVESMMGVQNTTVRPALYLKSTVKLQSGSGTIDDPYILQL